MSRVKWKKGPTPIAFQFAIATSRSGTTQQLCVNGVDPSGKIVIIHPFVRAADELACSISRRLKKWRAEARQLVSSEEEALDMPGGEVRRITSADERWSHNRPHRR